MKLVLDIDTRDARTGDWIRAALAGMHPSTDAACELADALRAAGRSAVTRPVDIALVVVAYANHDGNVSATARALGIARSTVRARLARATAAARALDAAPLCAANDNDRDAARRAV